MGDDSHVVFCKKIPWWKRTCQTVRCRDATASSFVAKVRGEVFAHFQAVAVKRLSIMQNWLFGLPGEILCKQPAWSQRSCWACYWLCSSPFSPISLSVSSDFLCTAHAFFPEHLYNHLQGLRHTFSEICTKFNAHSLSHQHVHPAAWNFVYWLPKYASTIVYPYIALLQLLHRWQFQSRKLWMPVICFEKFCRYFVTFFPGSNMCQLLSNT
jgi:hypothetical protein